MLRECVRVSSPGGDGEVTSPLPVVLAGDFNSSQEEHVYHFVHQNSLRQEVLLPEIQARLEQVREQDDGGNSLLPEVLDFPEKEITITAPNLRLARSHDLPLESAYRVS